MGYAVISNPVISRRAERHGPMLTNSLTWMTEEFDRYIEEIHEVPWFYNERALLGFFISGLVLKGHAIVLQEFSCYKGKGQRKKKKSGRADLYFKLKGLDYLVEAKWGYSLFDTRSGIDNAFKWAKEGLEQANQYAKDAKVKKANVFSICFEVIYCAEKNYKEYIEKIKKWQIKDENDLGKLDYYVIIETTADLQKKTYRYNNYLYPALAVYGIFNR